MLDIRIEKYRAEYEKQWDQFIQEKSVNGTFLQERRFLNYHREGRFKDCSILFFDKTNLIAVCRRVKCCRMGRKRFTHTREVHMEALYLRRRCFV